MKMLLSLLFLFSSLIGMDISTVGAVFDGEPDATVAGCVNVQGGEFFTVSSDIHVEAIEPITIKRVYVSSGHVDAQNIWTILPERLLYEENNTFYVNEPGGGVVPLHALNGQEYVVDISKLSNSVTNTAHGEIGAHTNIKNYKGYRFSESHMEITAPDGTIRNYRIALLNKETTQKKKKTTVRTASVFVLVETILPNGNHILYEYARGVVGGSSQGSALKKELLPLKITTTNPSKTITYASLSFAWNGDSLTFQTSTGQKGTYHGSLRHITKKENGYKKDIYFSAFDAFSGTHGQEEQLVYLPHTPTQLFLLEQRRHNLGRGLNASYYAPDTWHTNFDGGQIKTEKEDPRNYRVRELYEMCGPHGEMEPTHLFNYFLPGHTSHSPVTHVTFSDKSHAEYTFAPQRGYLTKHEIFDQKNHLLRTIEYGWNHAQQGNLLYKKFSGKAGKIRSLHYTYARNNTTSVKQETLKGNLTGRSSNEAYVKKYTTSPDRFHMPLVKKEANGLTKDFTYHSGTNLPKSICTYNGNTLLKRETREYDKNNLLFKHTIEDGKGLSFSTIYQRREESPAIGFPQEEYSFSGSQFTGKTSYTYDTQCRVTEKSVYDSAEKLLFTLNYEYDRFGNCIKETDPLGRVTNRTYNAFGQLLYEQKGNEPYSTTYTYDKMGRHTQQIRTSLDGSTKTSSKRYNKRSHLISSTDELGNKTTYQPDPLGRPLVQVLPGEREYTYKYDFFDQPISSKDPVGRESSTTYTARGDACKYTSYTSEKGCTIYHLDGRIKEIHTPKYIKKYSYDLYHNISSITHVDKQGQHLFTEFIKKYNAFYLLEETTSSGQTLTYSYDQKGRLACKQIATASIHYTYDDLDNLIHETHSLGNHPQYSISYTYDLAGRLLSKRKLGETNNLLSSTCYEYDQYDNIIAKHTQKTSEYFTYDGWNRLASHTDAEGNTTTYAYTDGFTYNKLSCSQKTTISPRGVRKIEIFDPDDHLLALVLKDPHGTTIRSEKHTYNKIGLPIKTVYASPENTITLHKEYDANGNLISLTEETNGITKTTRYRYNKYNERIETIKPSGTSIYYTYDAKGRKITLKSSDNTVNETRTYDQYDNLIAFTSHGKSIARTYDKNGNLLSETLPNGFQISSTYNDADQRTTLETPHGQTTYTFKDARLHALTNQKTHTYTYDQEENVSSEQNIYGHSYQHSYDHLGRKTNTHTPLFTETAAYDSEGNITSYSFNNDAHTYTYGYQNQLLTDNNTSYAYDAHYKPLSIQNTPLSYNSDNTLNTYASTIFTYDVDKRRTATQNTTYHYDALDRLIEIQTPSTKITFTYDTLNRLLAQTSHNTTTHFLYDDLIEIGDEHTLRIIGPTGTTHLLIQDTLYAPYTDLVGNIRTLSTTTLIEQYPYSLFGENTPSSHLSPYLYQTKRPITNLYHFGSRVYDPQTLQWLVPDPILYEDAPFLYQFLKNNPFTYSDEFGLSVSPSSTAMWNSWQQDTVPRYEFLTNDTLAAFHGITTNIIDTGNFIANAATLDFSFQGKPLQPIQDTINTGFSHLLSKNGSERFDNVSNAWNTTTSLSTLALGSSGVVKGVLRFGSLAKAPLKVFKIFPTKTQTSITPKNFFKQKTYSEMEILLRNKFGAPKPGAPGGKSFYNPSTKRTFHLHLQKGHFDGKPHIDIRRRGRYPERKFLLKEYENTYGR